MKVEKVFVVGAGLMGSGIAQVAAQSNFKTAVYDIDPAATDRALKTIGDSLNRMVKKGTVKEEDIPAIMANISVSNNIEEAADYDLVIEAVFEDEELKRKLFAQLDKLCKPETILATNTSAIAISKIAAATNRPEKVVGMHFFSPVPLMKLVEIVRGVKTSQETMDIACEVGAAFGKEVVRVERDFGGFIVNRVYLPYIKMSLQVLTEGVASVEEIDKAVKLGLGYPMGPFELGDMVGWDVMYNALTAIYKDTNDPAFAPPLLLKRMVDGGILGKKTGSGFYHYENGKRAGVNKSLPIM